LKQRAENTINAWKGILDNVLLIITEQIDKEFEKFNPSFEKEKSVLERQVLEGETQQGVIRTILDQYSKTIETNPNHIAFELLDKDPLNDTSVEYLCSQQEIWKE